jgi:hypothetical protein
MNRGAAMSLGFLQLTSMIKILLLITLQGLMHAIECLHDYHVIKGADPRERDHNEMWHVWDAVVWVMVHAAIAVAAGNGWLFFTGLAWRWLELQAVLNKLRGKEWTYLGSGFVDTITKRYLPGWWSLGVKVGVVLLFIYLTISHEMDL